MWPLPELLEQKLKKGVQTTHGITYKKDLVPTRQFSEKYPISMPGVSKNLHWQALVRGRLALPDRKQHWQQVSSEDSELECRPATRGEQKW